MNEKVSRIIQRVLVLRLVLVPFANGFTDTLRFFSLLLLLLLLLLFLLPRSFVCACVCVCVRALPSKVKRDNARV